MDTSGVEPGRLREQESLSRLQTTPPVGSPVDAPGDLEAPEAAPKRRWSIGLPRALTALQHRNFRLLWFGTIVSQTGDWMDQVALNWLVYQLTGSAVYLGLLNFCRLAPILFFTLIGGVVADRMERRRLLFSTQAAAMFMALALAILVSSNVVEVWMVLLIAVGRGVMMSFNLPARQSLISELVPLRYLGNAIGLNSATLNLTRVFGPALAGGVIATVGIAGAFYLNAASFLAVLASLALMRFPERPKRVHSSISSELVGGLRYLRTQPVLRALVLLALIPMVFGMPYMTMLTVFASDVLDVGATGLGMLTACTGVGAVLGALFVAARSGEPGRGRLMLSGLVGFGLALTLFALSPWLSTSVLTLVAVGVSQQVYMATNTTLIQTYVEEEFRGRILSTLFLNRSMVALGAMLAGFGAEIFGVQATVAGMAAVLVLLALFAARFAPATRGLD